MVKIRWTNAALDDLQAVHDYAASNSAAFAARLIERLIARTEILSNFPNSGRKVPEFNQPDLRELLEGSFRIIYRVVSEERVDITRIHHSAQPLGELG